MGGMRRSIRASAIAALAAALILTAGAAVAQTRPDADAYRGPVCFATITSSVQPTGARLLGASDSGKAIFSEGDPVFLDEAASLQPGEHYVIFRQEGVATHPRDGRQVGEIVAFVGTVEVTQVEGERAIGRLGPACGEIEVGDRLGMPQARDLGSMPEMPAFDPVRLVSPAESDATVVFGSGESLYEPGSERGRRDLTVRSAYAAGDVVTLDRGSVHGWGRGDAVFFYETRALLAEDPISHDEPVVVGQGYLIWVEADTAAVLITDNHRTVDIGARARRLR